MVLRTHNHDFQLFVFARLHDQASNNCQRDAGTRHFHARLRGRSSRLASMVSVLQSPPDANTGTTAQAKSPPPAVRDLEQNMKSEARRWHLGVGVEAALVLNYLCLCVL